MTRLRLFATLWLTLSIAACIDDTAAPVGPDADEAPARTASLDFFFPPPEVLTTTDSEIDVSVSDETMTEEELEAFQATNPWGRIINPWTRVSLIPGRAQIIAGHDYYGNVTELTIRATLLFQDKLLLSPEGKYMDQDPLVYGVFRSTFLRVLDVYTDKECGLEVHGNSVHEARFETHAPGLFTWGIDRESSSAEPESNGACGTKVTEGDGGGSTSDGGGIICYYYITYDLETGVIYAAELLYCMGTGGDQV